jgi:hypothetical protein
MTMVKSWVTLSELLGQFTRPNKDPKAFLLIEPAHLERKMMEKRITVN